MFDTTTQHRLRRELAHRAADGMEVKFRLLWNEAGNTISVGVLEGINVFELAVAHDRALDTFYHPYAYADRNDLVTR